MRILVASLLSLSMLAVTVSNASSAEKAKDAAPAKAEVKKTDAKPSEAKADEKAAKKDAGPVLNRKMKSLSGKTVDLSKYAGKVVLIVNTASKCGLTPQYEGLEKLHEKYNEKGLVVLGFPCNQFGGQEPGDEKEISEFCTNKYGVKFDMFAKINVNDEKDEKADPLYKYLTAQTTEPQSSGKIQWNFEKFIIGRDGKVAARFNPKVKPEAGELVAAIESELAKGPAAKDAPAKEEAKAAVDPNDKSAKRAAKRAARKAEKNK